MTDDITEALQTIKLHNNSKLRRFRKRLHAQRGPAGTPSPLGNRAWRRSDEGKAQMLLQLEKLRAYTEALQADNVHTHPMNDMVNDESSTSDSAV